MPQVNSLFQKFARFAVAILLLLSASLVFSSATRADSILINVTGPSAGPGGLFIGSAPGGTIWMGFSFKLTQGYSNVSISPNFNLMDGPATVTTWLTNGFGSGATVTNVIGSSTQTLTHSGPDTFLGGLNLAAGNYDILFSQSAGDLTWSLLNPAAIQLAPGVSLGDQLICVRGCVDRDFPPGSSWRDMGATPSSPFIITGTPTPVPEPSTLALLFAGIAGILIAAALNKKSLL